MPLYYRHSSAEEDCLQLLALAPRAPQTVSAGRKVRVTPPGERALVGGNLLARLARNFSPKLRPDEWRQRAESREQRSGSSLTLGHVTILCV